MSDKIIPLNEDLIKHDLKALFNKEADELVNAEKYERPSEHQGYRSGHHKRNLHTTAGEIELKVPKLKGFLLKQPSLNATAAENLLLKKR